MAGDGDGGVGSPLVQCWEPSFVSPAELSAAALRFPGVSELVGSDAAQAEGPRWEIVIAPGAIQVRTRDWAKASRYREREAQRHVRRVDELARRLGGDGQPSARRLPCREITGWSRKSRARMVHRLCELDYTPLFTDPAQLPAMLTLTYPGDWLVVAPNGRAVKRHLSLLRKRYQRAWGQDLAGVWKLEFQHRGAPHVHVLILAPRGTAGGRTFREWISVVWAQVVAHPDPQQHRNHELAGTGLDFNQGLRSRDPKRVAVYFTKHGCLAGKDYQHHIPVPWCQPGQGPGRFWGYWGLRPARAGVQLLPDTAIRAGRTLRRWARAQRLTQARSYSRVQQATGRVRYRTSRTRITRLPATADGSAAPTAPPSRLSLPAICC